MIDKVKVLVKAGRGGDGAVSFHREKFEPFGGPDGGDGGRGGSVYFVASFNVATLDDFRSKKVFKAGDGESGKKLKMAGKSGEDLFIKVPIGTIIFEGEKVVADLSKEGQTFLAAKGGRGGIGNYKFKSSINQTPTQYIPGEEGEEKEFILELKLIADVGIIGLPSAGKSTLINKLANTRAKTAPYHFTTLEPNLGVWEIEKGYKIILADIPGLIEGASLGKGLGDEFLRHIERTKTLIHVVDPLGGKAFLDGKVNAQEVFENYKVIQNELKDYKFGLWSVVEKPQVVVINKIDITEVKEAFNDIKNIFADFGVEVLPVSAVSGEGLDELRKKVLSVLSLLKDKDFSVSAQSPVKRYTIYNLPNLRKRPVLTKEVRGLKEGPKPKNQVPKNQKE